MPLELTLSPDQRYLEVRAADHAALLDIGVALKEAVQICRQAALTRVLVDARQVRASFTRLDLLNLAASLPSAGFLPGTRFAVLIDLETPDIHFFESAATSRGAIVDHYLDYDEALDDLLAPAFG
jgi:hypothetical protein